MEFQSTFEPEIISRRGVEFHPERLILAVPVLGIIAIGFVKSPGLVTFACAAAGLLVVLATVWWVQRYAESASIQSAGGALILREPRGAPLTIATRGAGRVVDLAAVTVGNSAQRWLIWIAPRDGERGGPAPRHRASLGRVRSAPVH